MNESIETLRRLLIRWYRQGQPWRTEPTLAEFRFGEGAKSGKEVIAVLDTLLLRVGPSLLLKDLRMRHLVELQQR